MSTSNEIAQQTPTRSRRRQLVVGAVVLAVVAAIALDTTVIKLGSEQDIVAVGFSPEAFGAAEFPRIRENIVQRAVEAQTLAEAITADQAAAAAQYGVPAGIGSVIPVQFTGVVGEGRSGIYNVAVEGLPDETGIRVQTGPAINGTDLRDSTGDIAFGDFRNQIEYQNAGAAINNAMKEAVLAGLDTSDLEGRTISVVGAFTLINPKNWLITPVEISVQ